MDEDDESVTNVTSHPTSCACELCVGRRKLATPAFLVFVRAAAELSGNAGLIERASKTNDLDALVGVLFSSTVAIVTNANGVLEATAVTAAQASALRSRAPADALPLIDRRVAQILSNAPKLEMRTPKRAGGSRRGSVQ